MPASSKEILVPIPEPVVFARFLRRERRFLVEVENETGRFWAHTNNTGSMLGLLRPGVEVVLSTSANPKRRLPHTLEMVRVPDFKEDFLVGVNTLTPNRMVRAAWEAGLLPEAVSYASLATEPGFPGGRLDAKFSGDAGELYVETKNVTMVEDGAACFPDAPTRRGQKHLRELARLAGQGRKDVRAACLFLVQRPDGDCFAPADCVDPEYADLFWKAVDAGVEMLAYRAVVSPRGVGLGPKLPLTGLRRVAAPSRNNRG